MSSLSGKGQKNKNIMNLNERKRSEKDKASGKNSSIHALKLLLLNYVLTQTKSFDTNKVV